MLHFVRALGESGSHGHVAAVVRSFLASRGFRERGSIGTQLEFRRSSQLATVFALDPARWRIDLSIDTRSRTAQMFVLTDGQIVTPREYRYFEMFFEELVAVMAPEQASETALALRDDQPLSRRAARAAFNENVAVTVGFFMSLPTLTVLLHAVVAVPMLWAIIWAFGGSLAIAYACLFSVKNRAARSAGRPLLKS